MGWPGGWGDGGTVGVGYNPNKDPWDTATQWGDELTRAKAGGQARGQQATAGKTEPQGPQATKGHQGGRRETPHTAKQTGLFTHQASGLDSHAGIRGQKDNKSYFSCKRSWTSGKIRAPLYDMPNC